MKSIPYSTQYIDDDDINAVISTLKSDFLTQGSKVGEFERKIADFIGVKYAISFNSATSALNIAYKIIKHDLLNKGDSINKCEFLTTPLTFCATANMMLENGISPHFCEINEMGNIDETSLPISQNTKAIVSVDYAGNSVNADKIAKICKDNNLYFIADSSHSFGGAFKGRKVGSLADMTIFSFHALKPITTMEGGAIATNNVRFYKLANLLKSHGIIKKELWDSEIWCENGDFCDFCDSSDSGDSNKMGDFCDSANLGDFIGHNFRLSDVAASLGISQLSKLESFLSKRTQIARIYDDEFSNIAKFRTLKIPHYIKSSYHLYPILLDSTLFSRKREIFRDLLDCGLGVQVHYKPLHQFSLYKNHTPIKSADSFYSAEISIPCHQRMSENDVDFVISTIKKIFKKY